MPTNNYDAILVVSFGGPEGTDDVMPFLEKVTRGRNVPRDRLLEVSHHYQAFGGVSPHNQQIRALIDALEIELKTQQIDLPIYWGNRNWHPLLDETMQKMAAGGIKRAIAFVTSGFSSYSSCRQYRENVEHAQRATGAGAPTVDKIRAFYNHPGFIHTMRNRVHEALKEIPTARRQATPLLFTAHSIPQSMADHCRYTAQLTEAMQLVTEGLDAHPSSLVYQSRSGPPTMPWLEPDVCDAVRQLRQDGQTDVVLVPIGFISDHMEVLYDLDTEAKQVCDEIGLNMIRAKTAGTHPKFVAMIVELIRERIDAGAERLALGQYGPSHDVCPVDCCPAPRPRPIPAASHTT